MDGLFPSVGSDKPLLVWHFLRQDWETDSGSIKTKIGETYHVEPPMVEILPADLQTRYIESRKQ